MFDTRYLIGVVSPVILVAQALAQSSSVSVAHDDPDGVVSPGETARFEVRVSWEQAHQILRLAGGVGASPDLGVVGGIEGPSPAGYLSGSQSSPGIGVNGSLVGLDLNFTPEIFTPGGIPSVSTCSNGQCGWFVAWEWTAPSVSAPTQVAFDFLPIAGSSGVWGTPSLASPVSVPLAATYRGTSLLVVPTPAGWLPLCSAALLVSAWRRRR